MVRDGANITWSRHIRYSKAARADAIRIRRDIRKRELRPFTYLIVMPEGGDRPELYHNMTLLSSFHGKCCYKIVGIAEGRDEALELFERMIADVYKKDPGLNYAEYFADNS